MLAIQDNQGQRVIGAVRPVLEEWVGRRWGGLTYRMTQIISGHGCFAAYLYRIGKEETRNCHYCDDPEDTAQHILESCPAWAEEREELDAIGPNLLLPAIIRTILYSEELRRAFSSFCERVMRKKEEAERERRGQIPRNRRQANRRGGRGQI